MALSAVCGYKPPSYNKESNFTEFNDETCGNFLANSTLALPPFSQPATNLGRSVGVTKGSEHSGNTRATFTIETLGY